MIVPDWSATLSIPLDEWPAFAKHFEGPWPDEAAGADLRYWHVFAEQERTSVLRVPLNHWNKILHAQTLPLVEEVARADRRYWAERARLGLCDFPTARKLSQRWKWAGRRVKLLLADAERWSVSDMGKPSSAAITMWLAAFENPGG